MNARSYYISYYKLLVPLVSICSLYSANIHALNWESSYGASLSTGYDDNFYLATKSNEIDTTFANFSFIGGLQGKFATTNLQLQAGISRNDYSEKSIVDRTNSDLLLSVMNQYSDRLHLELNLSAQKESSIETELLDTGLILDGTRNTVAVSPKMSYQLNERNSIVVDLLFNDVSYDDVPIEDYEENLISLGWKYQINEARAFSTILGTSKFKPEISDEANIVDLTFDYEYQPSAVTTYNFYVGLTEVDGSSGSEDGGSYGARVSNIQDEINSFLLSISHDFQASGLGVVREEDRLSLNWLHAYSERMQGTIITEFISTDGRDYFEVKPGLLYRVSVHAFFTADYRYRQQDGTTGDADSHSLLLSFSYNN